MKVKHSYQLKLYVICYKVSEAVCSTVGNSKCISMLLVLQSTCGKQQSLCGLCYICMVCFLLMFFCTVCHSYMRTVSNFFRCYVSQHWQHACYLLCSKLIKIRTGMVLDRWIQGHGAVDSLYRWREHSVPPVIHFVPNCKSKKYVGPPHIGEHWPLLGLCGIFLFIEPQS